MSSKTYYKKGEWNALCDSCGRKFKSSALRQRWDGLMVCKDDWETRHPQEFVRARVDTQIPVWTRPEPADTFVAINYTLTIIDDASFSFADSVIRQYGADDAVGLTDNASSEVEKAMQDTISLTDSVVPRRIFSQTINVHQINYHTLG